MRASLGSGRRILVLVALVFPALGGAALACPVCYGNAEGPMIDAARLGMFLLLAVVIAMQGAFGAFFLYLRRQARRAQSDALDQEWSKLQREWAGNRSMDQ